MNDFENVWGPGDALLYDDKSTECANSGHPGHFLRRPDVVGMLIGGEGGIRTFGIERPESR
jgi:hypothetical protein